MKLLVTGGAGFIGSAVVRQAVGEGMEVVNLDALTYAANLANVSAVADAPNYAFVKADITDRSALDAVFSDHAPDAVMHLAAESHVDRSIDGPDAFMTTNVMGTFHLLEAARAHWQRGHVHRRHILRSAQPLLGQQGRQRPSGTGLGRDLWIAGHSFELL